MPNDDGMGLGPQSAEKFQDFEGIVDIVMKRAFGALDRFPNWRRPYIWIDLTAGSGYDTLVDGTQLQGTPLHSMERLRERAQRTGIPFAAAFFERHATRAKQLRETLRTRYGQPVRGQQDFAVHATDSFGYLASFSDPQVLPGTLGAFVYDPTEQVDLDFIADLARCPHLKRYDLIIYVSATSIKRPRMLPGDRHTDRRTLIERLQAIDKRYCIVRKPSGPSQWSWFILTNDDKFPVWRKARGRANNLDFFDTRTPEGLQVLDELNWTKAELRDRDFKDGLFGDDR
jgi:hypothetical protein